MKKYTKAEMQSVIRGAKRSNAKIFTTSGKKISAKDANIRIVRFSSGGWTAIAKKKK